MWRYVFLFTLVFGVSAQAGPNCSFLTTGDASLGDDTTVCRESALLGGITQHSCYWVFDYRAEQAATWLNTLRSQVEDCMGPDTAMAGDAQVNHPDSFDLHQYEGQGRRVALSLKDKAGLNQTLVFLSISQEP